MRIFSHKRAVLAAVSALICVLLFCGRAEDGSRALYPIRENGLWGYMNARGETVIAPQWDTAGFFSQGRAVIGICDASGDYYEGLIDREGNCILEPRYSRIVEEPYCYLVYGSHTESVGWLDKASGFFQEPVYRYLYDNRTDSNLILADSGEEYAYLYRDSGRIAIPLYAWSELYLLNSAEFSEGFACLLMEEADGNGEFSWLQILIDTNGKQIIFPEGIYPEGIVSEGVLRITDGAAMCGLARPDGTVIVEPRYDFVSDVCEDRAFFLEDCRLGIMDPEGNIILPAVLEYDPGWKYFRGREEHFFHHGYAVEYMCDEELNRYFIIIDRDGGIVFASPKHRVDSAEWFAVYSLADRYGLVWYRVSGGEAGEKYGLLKLSADRAEYLTEAVYDDIPLPCDGELEFSEGLMPVSLDGIWGFINEQAEFVIPPYWDDAWCFRDSLAMVEKDGKLAYIDHDGTIVWQERGEGAASE